MHRHVERLINRSCKLEAKSYNVYPYERVDNVTSFFVVEAQSPYHPGMKLGFEISL